MYLTASKYVGGWEHTDENERLAYRKILEILGLPDVGCEHSPNMNIEVTVAYWRKANQVHNWFVKNCQGGEDNCQKTYVPREKLQELLDTCCELLRFKDSGDEKEVVEKTLPPTAGFFFGSIEIDDWYWQDIEDTITQLEKVLGNPELANMSFYYEASW